MITDWKLRESLSALKRRIGKVEDELAPYRVVHIQEGYVDYRINDGYCPVKLANKIDELNTIHHKIKEMI